MIAGIEASMREDLKIILVSKGPVSQSGITPTANGGTAASDSADGMFKNMITAGCFLNDQNIAWLLASEIRNCLKKLEQWEIPYTPMGPGSVCVPSTSSLRRLRELAIKKTNIDLFEDVLITSLLTSDGKISGATALDLTTGEFFVIKATAVLMATGGLVGELYPHSSNNPFGVTTDSSGTGHIMAYLAGAELIDTEMIQFVPLPANPRCVNMRYFPDFWEGPYLNRDGEAIISDVSIYPGKSYSHFVTQKIFSEWEKGKGPIYIDHRDLKTPIPTAPAKSLESKKRLIKSLGIDPRENKIEIIIGSHFCMGGIRVNEKTASTIPGLYAAGEVMGGVHGGLRIPGYSLSQIIVFGFEAGAQVAKYAQASQKPGQLPIRGINIEKERVFQFLAPKSNPVSVSELKKRLQRIMEEHVFIFRDKTGLTEAIKKIRALKKDVSRINVPDFKRFNLTWSRAIEFSLTIEAAEIIAESALSREESRGAHYRRDFPAENNKQWLKHTVAKLEAGQLKIGSAPVVLDRMKPEVQA